MQKYVSVNNVQKRSAIIMFGKMQTFIIEKILPFIILFGSSYENFLVKVLAILLAWFLHLLWRYSC